MAILGFTASSHVTLDNRRITPSRPVMQSEVTVEFDLTNPGPSQQRILVDLRVHFVKASGRVSPKVFKLKSLVLAAQESTRLRKTLSLVDLSTRRHYPGEHKVELLINGVVTPIGSFLLTVRSD